MTDAGRAPGWWMASDGRWYPAELHPAHRGLAQAPGRVGRRGRAALSAALMVAIVACLVGIGVVLRQPVTAADGLSGKSAAQVLDVTLGAVSAAGSVQLHTPVGPVNVGRQAGDQIISGAGIGSARIVVVGGVAYLRADARFLEVNAGFSSSGASAYAGHWIAFHPSDAPYAALAEGLTLSSALTGLRPAGPLHLGTPTTLDGQAVVGVVGSIPASEVPAGVRGTVVLDVSEVAPFLPVSEVVTETAGGRSVDTVRFSGWGEHVAPSAPAGSVAFSSLPASATTS